MQIVVGLLCDDEGIPLSIEVFPGNTQDTKTFAHQVKKVAERFGGGEVTFVGDRGMIRGPQIEQLQEFKEHKFHYISALSKPQIEVLLREGILQMSLFDETVTEVLPQDNQERYVLRRNPIRAAQVKQTRQSKLNSLEKTVQKYNLYLKEHPKARVEVGHRKMQEKVKKLKVKNWVEILDRERELSVRVKPTELYEEEKLDGCYVLRTDLSQDVASKETIHQRYKDLALVEQVFRTSKTTHLEMRPIFVQRDTRTRGHAFVVMMAYLIVRALSEMWREFDLTVEEGIHQLATICAQEVFIDGKPMFQTIPEPREDLKRLLDAANVTLPEAIPYKGVVVQGQVAGLSAGPDPSSCHPPSQCGSGITDIGKVVIVVPAKSLDLLEQVQALEIPGELDDKVSVEPRVEGIVGKLMLEIVQHVGDAWFEGERRLRKLCHGIDSFVRATSMDAVALKQAQPYAVESPGLIEGFEPRC